MIKSRPSKVTEEIDAFINGAEPKFQAKKPQATKSPEPKPPIVKMRLDFPQDWADRMTAVREVDGAEVALSQHRYLIQAVMEKIQRDERALAKRGK